MKIKIIKTYTESFKNVFAHKLDWVRAASGPILIGAIGLFLLGTVYAVYGNPFGITKKEFFLKFELPYSFIIAHIAFVIALLTAIVSLYINFFRYAVLGEGKDEWITLNLDKRFAKMLLYGFLMAVSFIIGILIFLLVIKLSNDLALKIILGIFAIWSGLYLFTRLNLVMISIALDQKAPLATSWRLMKGNVLRVWTLNSLLSMTFSFLSAVVGGMIVFILGFIGLEGTLTFDLITGLVTGFTRLLGWVVTAKATGGVFQTLSEKQTV